MHSLGLGTDLWQGLEVWHSGCLPAFPSSVSPALPSLSRLPHVWDPIPFYQEGFILHVAAFLFS